jgi:AraC family transcriptional regulator, transcriptional activator FtrA
MKPRAMGPPNRRVAAVAYDRLSIFELGIVIEVFARRRPELKVDWYDFRVCALDRGPLRATGGVAIQPHGGLGGLRDAGTIVIPGWRDLDERPPEVLLNAVRAGYARGARLVTICSGVFVLAAAGLLDGRRATTHWLFAERLQTRFPNVRVEPDVLFVDEGQILTSAGSAAGLDLCLHIVRADYGAEIANQVARRLVVPPQREGGQSQYIPAVVRNHTANGLARVLEWAQQRLHEPLSVERLADRAAMSGRTFARRFREETGTTPHQWLTHQRLIAAQRRLETTQESMDDVAEAVGLRTAATLRLHFRDRLGTTPTAYRRRFSIEVTRPASSGQKIAGATMST